MKKFLFAFILLFIFTISKAQPYYKMLGDSNSWSVTVDLLPVKASAQASWGMPCLSYYLAFKDSLYDGKNYKVFSPKNFGGCLGEAKTALIREDTISKKVYAIVQGDTTEYVAIDFSLNTGDSIYLQFSASNNILKPGYYRLDSIVTRPEVQGPRKHFYLHRHGVQISGITGKEYYLEWIESIGATHFPISFIDDYGFLNFSLACPAIQYNSTVICKTTNAIKYYQDSCVYFVGLNNLLQYVLYINPCEIHMQFPGGLPENSVGQTFRVYPDPAGSEIKVKTNFTGNSPVKLTVYDSFGKVISIRTFESANDQILIPVEQLNAGMYLLQVQYGEIRGTIRFLKN